MALLRAAKTNSEDALNRLCELVEQGPASPTDRDFAERLTHNRQRIAALTTDIASLERQLASSWSGGWGAPARTGVQLDHWPDWCGSGLREMSLSAAEPYLKNALRRPTAGN